MITAEDFGTALSNEDIEEIARTAYQRLRQLYLQHNAALYNRNDTFPTRNTPLLGIFSPPTHEKGGVTPQGHLRMHSYGRDASMQ